MLRLRRWAVRFRSEPVYGWPFLVGRVTLCDVAPTHGFRHAEPQRSEQTRGSDTAFIEERGSVARLCLLAPYLLSGTGTSKHVVVMFAPPNGYSGHSAVTLCERLIAK